MNALRNLLFPDVLYVVRSDRRVVTIPPMSRARRFAHRLFWETLFVYADKLRSVGVPRG